MKTTEYFQHVRKRPDREMIKDTWILHVVKYPEFQKVQSDGRIRRWAKIKEMDDRFLRVILLDDRKTIHNAFFDRRFKGHED